MFKSISTMTSLATCIAITGCAATGEQYQANVYRVGQVNQVQQAKTVQILAVMPAQIEVDNTKAKEAAQMGGALFGAILGAALGNAATHHQAEATAGGAVGGGVVGAAAGGFVSDKKLVPGVSLTYVDEGNTLNSAQVGKLCEYQPGLAVVISTSATETRIQANATCSVEVTKK